MNNYSQYQQEAIQVALSAIQYTLVNDDVMNSPKEVKNYLTLELVGKQMSILQAKITVV